MSDAPAWLMEVVLEVNELNRQHPGKLKELVIQWAKKDTSLPLPFPQRELSVGEMAAVLVAIHDVYIECDEPITPFPVPNAALLDRSTEDVIEEDLPLTDPQSQRALAASKRLDFIHQCNLFWTLKQRVPGNTRTKRAMLHKILCSVSNHASKAGNSSGNARPCAGRDSQFWKWNQDGVTPAKICEQWNALSDLQRKTICPKRPEQLTAGKYGRQVVETALKREKRRRQPKAE